jgi:nucleoside 2-deoxyribosyltransferase
MYQKTEKDYVYLAGPMEDLTKQEMCSWRARARDLLDLMGIGCLDPTRRVTFHDELTKLQDQRLTMNACRSIFKQDLQDIANSKVVLADVRRSAGRGIGTNMEVMFAHTKHKVIILVVDEKDPIHPFYESVYTEKHTNFEEAIHSIRSYY